MASKMIKCPVCDNVTRVKTLSMFWLIIWLIGFFPIGIIYLILRTLGSKKCSHCKSKI